MNHPPTPDDVRKFDQNAAVVADNLPPMRRRMFGNLITEGFTPDEALSLLRTYIRGIAGGRFTER